MTTTLLLMRHGETDWNAAGRFQGHTDIDLNERGLAQAREAVEVLSTQGIRRVVSSDLGRAVQTARVVANALGLPVEQDPGLRERSFGVFEGLTWPEIEVKHAQLHAAYQVNPHVDVPGAENLGDLRARARRMLHHYAQAASLAGHTVLLVSHGGMVRSMLWHVMGDQAPKPIANARPYAVAVDGDRLHDVRAL